MEKHFNLLIPQQDVEKYNSLMSAECLDYGNLCISRYSTIDCWTVDCGDGYEVDLKVCSSDNGDPLWCEAVLFKNGNERTCTEVESVLDGDWGLCVDDISFIVHVESQKC